MIIFEVGCGKMKFELTVVRFNNNDVITTSELLPELPDCPTELPE